jgi:hypothetical protein
MPESTRRNFLKTVTTASAAALTLAAAARAAQAAPPRANGKSVVGLRTPKLEVVRWGFIGLGARGGGTLQETMLLEHCEIRALCDNHAPTLAKAVPR